MMPKAQREAHEKLMADLCRCGESKVRGRAFCRECFYSLPGSLRSRLERHPGDGFEAAYDEAVITLASRGKVPV